MRRIQVHLDEDMDEALAKQARERGIPKAVLIREYLARHVTSTRHASSDPSEKLIGIYDGTPDESGNVDAVVYDR